VHPEWLERQKLPEPLVSEGIWQERFEDIRSFERYLARNGVLIRKFFLHISREEQKRRFLDRLEEPEKHWKFQAGDVTERQRWDSYMAAYEDAIRRTSAPWAPWVVVPADRKWFARVVVAAAIVEALESLNLTYPTLGPEALSALHAAREQLLAEED
ncbi:MAG: polyphosphate kinase 2 family protein, partial [bacterium]